MDDRLKIAVVLGTRPEAVKLLPVIRLLRGDARFATRVFTTGQHKEMVEEILAPFGVVADVDLGIMQAGQTLNDIVSRSVPRLDGLFLDEKPQVVMVQGDTTSAFCAALAAYHLRIPVAHLEAGLRSFDRDHPFPEEVNRRMVSVVTEVHLAPTRGSADNLLREGVPASHVVVTGNTVVDALLMILAARKDASATTAPYVLITLHRREAWDGAGGDSPLDAMLEAIRAIAAERPEMEFVYPVHYNPRVRGPAQRILGDLPNVRLIAPLPYIPFVERMAGASAILTDSGGIQEEAPSLGVPVLVLRRTTERPEGVSAGMNRLVGTDPDRIRAELAEVLDDRTARGPIPRPNPFGDGRASERVRDALLHFILKSGPRPVDFSADPLKEAP